MKRFLSLALACIMALGLAGTGLAAAEPTTISVLVRTGDLTPYAAWIETLNKALLDAGVGVQLKWYSQPSSGYPDFVNNMLLTWKADEIYDLIYIQGAAIDANYLGSMGLLTDMTDLLANSTYAKGVYEASPILSAQFASCPFQLWPSTVNRCLQFRSDVLAKCPSYEGFLQSPTIENLTAVLREVKAQGFAGAMTINGIDYLFNTGVDSGFGITSTWMKQEDGSYRYNRVSDEFLAELTWWADMYKEGVLSANFATDNWESMENSLYTSIVAGIGMKGGAYTVYYDTNTVKNFNSEAALTILPPAMSADGDQQYNITANRFDRGWVISSTCKAPEKAFAVLDYMFSDAGRKLDLFGLEGTDYTVNADGTYSLIHNSSEINIYRILDADVFGNIDVPAFTAGGVPYWPAASFQSAAMMAKYGVADNDFVIPAEYATNWAACETLWREFATQFILGEKTTSDWAAYVDTWNSYGGAAVAQYAASILNK